MKKNKRSNKYKTKRAFIMIHKDFFSNILDEKIIKVVSLSQSNGEDQNAGIQDFFGVLIENNSLGGASDPLPAYTVEFLGKDKNGKNKLKYSEIKEKKEEK